MVAYLSQLVNANVRVFNFAMNINQSEFKQNSRKSRADTKAHDFSDLHLVFLLLF